MCSKAKRDWNLHLATTAFVYNASLHGFLAHLWISREALLTLIFLLVHKFEGKRCVWRGGGEYWAPLKCAFWVLSQLIYFAGRKILLICKAFQPVWEGTIGFSCLSSSMNWNGEESSRGGVWTEWSHLLLGDAHSHSKQGHSRSQASGTAWSGCKSDRVPFTVTLGLLWQTDLEGLQWCELGLQNVCVGGSLS